MRFSEGVYMSVHKQRSGYKDSKQSHALSFRLSTGINSAQLTLTTGFAFPKHPTQNASPDNVAEI
jgi:hypothetical protein